MAGHALKRILIVDDDPLIGAAACLALEAAGGYTVELCESGRDALDVARRFQPDMMLLDAMIPDLDGPTTLAAFRRTDRFAELPVVFMTGRSDPLELQEFKALGAHDVIAKPFDPMTLARRVAEIWSRTDA